MSRVIVVLLFGIVCGGVVTYWWINKNEILKLQNQQRIASTNITPTTHEKFYETVSLVPLTICEAIRKGTQATGAEWDALVPANDTQKKFIVSQYTPYMQRNLFDKFSSEELKAYASRDYQYLNDILIKNGFTIQLEPFPPESSIGIVAIQDIIVKWPEVGEKVTIEADGQRYEGVHQTQEYVKFFSASDDPSIVIVELLTKTDDRVYFVTKLNGQLFEQTPDDAMVIAALMKYQSALRDGSYKDDTHYNGVKFPMISYNKKPNVSWLLDLELYTELTSFIVAQALQEIIFKMNEKGAQAKVATACELMATCSEYDLAKETLIIDQPFLLWIERPGVPMPLFSDYMTKEYWQNPGELPE